MTPYIFLAALAGLIVVTAALPAILARVLDPIATRSIKKYCNDLGLGEVQIKAWPNHYAVKFSKNGVRHSAKCRVVWRKIRWIGKSPEEF